MSESRADSAAADSALGHSGQIAQWAVILLGWLWLGEQGTRLGWSLASGVLAVAVWWSVRIFFRGSTWALQCSPAVIGFGGLLTAGLVCLPSWVEGPSAQHASLIGVALVWGLWSAAIETRRCTHAALMSPAAWHPLVAAVIVLSARSLSHHAHLAAFGVSLLLVISAVVLNLRDRSAGQRILKTVDLPGRQHTNLQHLLAPSAMGLMMGSLWLGNVWCAGLGFSIEAMVMLHVVFMAGLPTIVALLLRCLSPVPLSRAVQTNASLVLLILGAFMMLGTTAAHSVLAMLLPSLAWAIHSVPRPPSVEPPGLISSGFARSMALFLGPVLLVGVGLASPLQGPLAVQLAMAWLGFLAFACAVFLHWHVPAPNPPLERVHDLAGAALERNRDEWTLRMRRMGSCPCKQTRRYHYKVQARYRSNP